MLTRLRTLARQFSFRQLPRWKRAAAISCLLVGLLILVLYTLGGPGSLAYRYFPATWYFALIEWKHGDPVAQQRQHVSLAHLRQYDRLWVILVVGQSNGGNHSPRRTQARSPHVFNYYKGQLTKARDPLPGSTGSGGSPWPAVGDAVVEAGAADAVVFSGASIGGSSVSDWAPGGRFHPVLLQRLADLEAAGLTPTHVLWHQGESDTALGTSATDYKTSLTRIIKSLREEGVEAAFFVAKATFNGDKLSPQVRAAQDAVVDPGAAIFPGPDTDALNGAWRFDGLHWSAEGIGKVAELWVQTLLSNQGQDSKRARVP